MQAGAKGERGDQGLPGEKKKKKRGYCLTDNLVVFQGAAGIPGRAGFPGAKGYPGQVGLTGSPGKTYFVTKKVN